VRAHARKSREELRGREREKESEADSMLSTETYTGLDPSTMRPRPEQKLRVGCANNRATQAPLE